MRRKRVERFWRTRVLFLAAARHLHGHVGRHQDPLRETEIFIRPVIQHLQISAPNSRTPPCYFQIGKRPRAPHRAAATSFHPGQDALHVRWC
jgi:hypothetical protein